MTLVFLGECCQVVQTTQGRGGDGDRIFCVQRGWSAMPSSAYPYVPLCMVPRQPTLNAYTSDTNRWSGQPQKDFSSKSSAAWRPFFKVLELAEASS